jgi:hypothetical protein
MPTPTYTPLANITLGSSAATITFGSIPATYRDLIVVLTPTTASQTDLFLRLNGDTGNNYYDQRMRGSGTAAVATVRGAQPRSLIAEGAQPGNNISVHIINFLDYSQTNKHKTILSRSNNAGLGVEATASRWASTAAMTSFQFSTGSTFNAGTTAALYGIVA